MKNKELKIAVDNFFLKKKYVCLKLSKKIW